MLPRDMSRVPPRWPTCCGRGWPQWAVQSVAGGERGPAGVLCPQQVLIHSSQARRALGALGGGEGGRARLGASPLPVLQPGPLLEARPFPAACAARAQPRPAASSAQGAPARERPCSCSSAPASSASSRPLSEPSKQPESRGMSPLGSDRVCTAGSWLLSAPSSASSLPAASDKGGRWNMGRWVRREGGQRPQGALCGNRDPGGRDTVGSLSL